MFQTRLPTFLPYMAGAGASHRKLTWRHKKGGGRCFHRHVTVSTLPSPSFTFPHLCIFLLSREIILSWRRDIASCMLHGRCDCFATSSYCARGCSGHGGHVQGAPLLCPELGLEHWWVTNRCGPSKTNAFRQDYVEIKSPGLKKSVGQQGPRGSKGRSTGSQAVKG